jgi:hypothetical protein
MSELIGGIYSTRKMRGVKRSGHYLQHPTLFDSFIIVFEKAGPGPELNTFLI